jgi:2-haloacid dehalogenase
MAHARHESSQQRATPALAYARLLAVVYKRLERGMGGAGELGGVPRLWPLGARLAGLRRFGFAALQYLKQHYKLVILSNVDNESFAYSNAKLEVAFDAVYTAEDIGSYKPDARNFTYMIDKLATLGVEAGQVLHTAESLFHDHQPANEFGLASCWIHRRHDQEGFGATMDPGARCRRSISALPAWPTSRAHQAELGG